MNRRTVLKGGIAVALTAHTAVASGDLVSGSFQELVKEHAVTRDKMRALWAFVDDTIDAEDTPKPGFVRLSEIGPDYRSMGKTEPRHFAKQVDEAFDHEVLVSRRHIEWGMTVAAHEKRLERLEVDRKRAHQILKERDQIYQEWRVSSGVQAADDESERLGFVVEGLEQRIIGWTPSTIQEAGQKTDWIMDNWKWLGDDGREDAVRHLVTGRAAA